MAYRARLKLLAWYTIILKVKCLVELQFADERLKHCFLDKAYASMHLGREVADRYAYLLNFIGCIDSASDLQRFAFLDTVAPPNISGSWSWSVSLDAERRLLLQPVEDGKAIRIMEIAA